MKESDKKPKETLQQKLTKRKYHKPNRLYNTIYYVIMYYFVGKKYKPHITVRDKISDCKGPCFLIWNHLSRLDHLYATAAAYPRPLSIVAGYNEFFRSHLHTVFDMMKILPKKNFTNDLPGIRAMNSIIRKGGCVCFSPEGTSSLFGYNQPIVPGTGKFIKHYRIPVYFMKLQGTYLTSTKTCLDERYGRTEAELSLLFTPEQLDEMTADEIQDKINEVFRHDDYAWQREQHIKWETNGTICNHLHDICYRCPRCGAELEMTSEKDYIKCRKCGNGAKMNDYYEFLPFDSECNIPISPSEWVTWERREIIREIREDKNYSYTEHCKLGYLQPDEYVQNQETSVPCGEGDITFDHEGIHFSGTKLGQPFSFDLSYATVYSLINVTSMDHFALYVKEEFYEFFPEKPSTTKCLLITEEMHRLHFNTWKNFPWNAYMYEGYELPEETNSDN